MRKTLAACLLLLGPAVFCQQPASIKEYRKAFTTYPFSDPSPIPMLTPVYPYSRFDGFSATPVQKEWKVVELENQYIRLMILPEIGGKIWAAIEKSTDKPFIYYNHVVKFRDVAMRGPWTSGGIEANYGIIGHTPNCATPVDYTTKTNEDGSVTCTIGALDLLTRSNWRLEINLQRDKAYFTTKSFWYNSTAAWQPYYTWMNEALKAADDLEFIYPGNRYLGHEGEYADWPINKSNGKNISFYRNNDFGGYKSYHVFGSYTDFYGAYYHDEDFGMVRYGSHDDKPGKKIWIWGLSRQGMIWDKLLTDNDGQYVELQSGRLFNQTADKSTFTPFKHTGFSPYGTDTWKEYWYPVKNSRGIVQANEYGALNVKNENGWLKIYFSTAQEIDDTLQINEGDKTIYIKKISLAPLQTFSDSIKYTGGQFVASLGNTKLHYNSDTSSIALSRPVQLPEDFDWNTAYGLYLQGRDAFDAKQYPLAEEKLGASLKKDRHFLPALVSMAELLYRNLRYVEALDMAKQALAIDTYDGAANYYYGLINQQLQKTVDAKDGFDIAALSSAYRSPAYTELSKLYLREKNYEKASLYGKKALEANAVNIDAMQIEAVARRYQNKPREVDSILSKIVSLDILNHFARFEKYFALPNAANKERFTSLITNELPAETYLELAIWYFNIDCLNEAAAILSMCPPSAEAIYWKRLLSTDRPEYIATNGFPFRAETAALLEKQANRDSSWIPRYHLALIYKDRNRITEAQQLLLSCKDAPGYAPFYAVRAGILTDSAMQLHDLRKALSIDGQWRYHKLLAGYYLTHGMNDEALAITLPFYKKHPDNYIIGLLHAKALLLNERYKDADILLTNIRILPFEGATEGRELFREAKLMQALNEMKNKKFSKALALIGQSKQWPENLGAGKPYDADIDTRLEDWLTEQCNKRSNSFAGADALISGIKSSSKKISDSDNRIFERLMKIR